MKSVLCLTKYSNKGASSRIRILSNVGFYEDNGYKFKVSPLLSDNYLDAVYSAKYLIARIIYAKCLLVRIFFLLREILFCKKYDIIYVEYEILPYIPWRFEGFLYTLGRKVLVEFDDPIYLKYKDNRFLVNKFRYLSEIASTIVVSSSVMRSHFLSLNNNSTVKILDTPVDIYKTNHLQSKKNIVGWIGSPTSEPYLLNIIPKILPILKTSGWRLEVIGVSKNFLNLVGGEFRDYITITEWYNGVDRLILPTWKIGLLPLDLSEWTYARDAYKANMYLSMSIFTVCDNVPSTRELHHKYGHCVLVDDPSDWGEALSKSISFVQSRTGQFTPKNKYTFTRESYVNGILNIMNLISV